MMPQIQEIIQAMSLRKPQGDSLERLSRIAELLSLQKEVNFKAAEQEIRNAFPDFSEFERSFPNVCFALATGVGKTRLMGAMIAYLSMVKGVRNFMVLSPNTTITDKLVREFSNPNDPKYVFNGLPEFANRYPRIVTAEDIEKGTSCRNTDRDGFNPEDITIHIFNIAFIHTANRKIRKLNEMVEGGTSYFDFLKSRDDLVLFMDEAHRYRATAAMSTINELNPVLGIELTATPQVQEGNKAIAFRNVVYRFTLREALEHGFVKRLGICCRNATDIALSNDENSEKSKIEDGLVVHEYLIEQLKTYAQNHPQKKLVKPFVLVITRDTEHADQIRELIEKSWSGKYAGKTITVHSAKTEEEKEEAWDQLKAVESPENPIEIVIHVNMLREGWDVNNLYTIIPMRAADSRTLVEQSLGRGARLPFGQRTGIEAIDRLYIIFHQKFDEVVREVQDEFVYVEHIDLAKNIPQKEEIQKFTATPTMKTLAIPNTKLEVIEQGRYKPFNLDLTSLVQFRELPKDVSIIVRDPHAEKDTHIKGHIESFIENASPEDRLAYNLFEYYEDIAETEANEQLIRELARQTIGFLREERNDEEFSKIFNYQHFEIAKEIHRQLSANYTPCEMQIQASGGNVHFEPMYFCVPSYDAPLHYASPIPQDRQFTSVIWNGFRKSVYSAIQFDSRPELVFAGVLERDGPVLEWVKPPRRMLIINGYEPDFFVETETGRYVCEVKKSTDCENENVCAKAEIALEWCLAVNDPSSKPWKYLLIPHDKVAANTSFDTYLQYEWQSSRLSPSNLSY